MTDVKQLIEAQRRFFQSGATREVSFRMETLIKLKEVLKSNESAIFDTLKQDFNKPPFESYATEAGLLYSEIDHILKNLKGWNKPVRVGGIWANFPSINYIYSQPYGVSLVIGAWNYPVQLALNPVLGSVAAGNCTIIKPSELAEHSSHLLAKIINTNFDRQHLHVVEGDAETSQEILAQPLDYIFFTGSTRVGKTIMKAAAEQLTPVTLELGGKSPAIVDKTANLKIAARRIAWGKFMNAGQTCVAPDYVYVQKVSKELFVGHLCKEIERFYGTVPQASPDYARIINHDHFDRLAKHLEQASGIIGGNYDRSDSFIEPTLLTETDWNDPIMQEEIFGPLLPILEFKELDDVIEEINQRSSPLALYFFSDDKDNRRKVIEHTRFGGGCINDTVAHLGNHRLPFGGIGNSGMGNYHGKASFDTFSHQKSIMKKPTWFDIPLRYAPYKGNLKWLKKILR